MAKSLLVVVSLVLSVAIGLALRASASSGSTSNIGGKGAPVIGLSLDTLKEEHWQQDRKSFEDRAKQLGAVAMTQAANSDDAVQIKDITGLLSSGVQVLVIVPHNAEAMSRAVDLAHQQGVPVISYDRLITNSDVDLYCSVDNVAVGRLQGQFIVDQIPKLDHKPMKLCRIYGAKSDNNALLFKQGQDEALEPHIKSGEIEVVQEDWCDDWKPENAKRICEAALTKVGKSLDAVCASNDGTAGGAIQALTEEGIAGKVIVTGQDADLVACQRVMRGTQAMTVYKPTKKLAALSVDIAVKMIKGQPIICDRTVNNGFKDVPSTGAKVVTVTKENMMDTVVADGFHTKEEIESGSK